jgi:hypothetical protein
MGRFEYKILEIQVRRLLGIKVPEELGIRVDQLANEGWELDHSIPIMSKGFLGGSFTESVLLIFRRMRGEA